MANAGAADKCVGMTAALRGGCAFPPRDPRVPDAERHSSCRSAEPGPYQAPAFVTAPALQRTTPQVRRAALRPRHELLSNGVMETTSVCRLRPSCIPT